MTEWQYDVDEVGPDGAKESGEPEREVEPGSPQPENVAFFLLGVALAVALVASAV